MGKKVASCNVRSSPSKENDDNIIDTLLQGMSFKIDSFDGYWYHITYNGQEGYVSHKMIALKEGGSEIPAVAPSETNETTSEAEPLASENPTASEQFISVEGVLSGVKIGIDPGHQDAGNFDKEAIAPGSSEMKYKVSSGADGVVTDIPEYVTNLQISEQLRDKLREKGATVYMTRETHDVDISNQERAKMMNDYGVDLVLRVHCDSMDDSSLRGIALYVSKSNSIAEQSRAYAEIMLPIICEITGANNRGIYQNDNYTGQNWSEVPCMMIECGYLSNPEEDVLLNSPEYQDTLTTAILESIIACFGGEDNAVIQGQSLQNSNAPTE